MKRTRPRKRRRKSDTRPDARTEHTGTLLDRSAAYLASPWAPVCFFAVLSIVYFAGFVFTDNQILGLDPGTAFHRGQEPFLQKVAEVKPPNWRRYMGGNPETSSLRFNYYFPLHTIYFFTRLHTYFGWRYVIAMFCAGYFTYLCMRGFGLRPLVALLSGVAFSSAPTFLSFSYAGHFAKMSVIALFPLMVWSLYRGMETRRIIYFLLLGGSIGMSVYSPQIQMVYFSLLGLGLIFAVKLIVTHVREHNLIKSLHRSLLAAGAICLGLAIGAEGIFPQWYNSSTQTKRGASRGAESEADSRLAFATSWSLHPEEIASLVVPEFVHFDVRQRNYWGRNAFKANAEYFGIVVLFFAAFALSRIRKDPLVPLLLIPFLFAVAYSLGPHTPVHRFFYDYVPGVRALRVPGMIAFLFAFPACALAGLGLARVLSAEAPAPRLLVRLTIGAAVAVICLLALAVATKPLLSLWNSLFWPDIPLRKAQIAQTNLPNLSRGALIGALIVAVLCLLTRKRLQGTLSPATFTLLLIPLILFDTWRINKQHLRYADPHHYPPTEQINAGVVRFLKQDESLYRVFPLPDFRRVTLEGIDIVTGFYDFTIRRYDRITQPDCLQHFPILNLLNTKYIVSTDPLSIQGLQAVGRIERLHIYKNPNALPWFYLAPDYIVETDKNRILERLKDPEFDPAKTAILETEPTGFTPGGDKSGDRIEQLTYNERQGIIELRVQSGGSRLLVVSENHHPFWHAYVDGDERPLLRANYVWKAVLVPAGEHRVAFRYHDPITAACRWVTLSATGLFLVGIAAWFRWGRIRNKQTPVA